MLDDWAVELTQAEQQKEKKKKIRKWVYGSKEPIDHINKTNIHIIGIPGGEEKEKGAEILFEK